MKNVIKWVFVLFLVVRNCIAGQASQEEIKYHLIDLGTLGQSGMGATSINNKGEIVGYYSVNGYNRSFLYSRGVLRDMLSSANSTFPLDINDKGQIVGYGPNLSTPQLTAFLFSEGSIQYLDNLKALLYQSLCINNLGQIVGTFVPQGRSYPHAFIYENGNIKDLGTLGGISSGANAINDQGQIVGNVAFDSQFYRAFLYSNERVQDLGTLGGKKSNAHGLNNLGHVVGESQITDSSPNHAFVYRNGSMQDLGTLGGNSSSAKAINDAEEIVGISKITGNMISHGFLHVGGVMKDLNDLLVTPHADLYVYEATAINNMGQIVGRGITTEGSYRAVLLNPLSYKKTIEVIETQPTQPVYGNVPVKEEGKDSLVVVTHGWQLFVTPAFPKPDVSWLDEMLEGINNYMAANNLNTWQTESYKWIDKAWTFYPTHALNNAKQEGEKLGQSLASQDWKHIHLIAHSAGSALIQAACEQIKAVSTSTTVHCTFLDPYVGKKFEGVEKYGNRADWSDQYFSRDSTTQFGSIMTGPFTESLLAHAYNVDVTPLDEHKNIGKKFRSSVTGQMEPCIKTFTSHQWPHKFYLKTITGDVTADYQGFGFPLSKEGGGWSAGIPNYAKGNDPAQILGTPDPLCVNDIKIEAPKWVDKFLNFTKSPTIQSDTGTIEKTSESSVTLSTGSPVWLAAVVTVTNPVNILSFDARFSSLSGAQGLLSVLWDDQIIGTIDERVITSNSFTFRFSNAVSGSSHFLGFRLDPFTNIQSVVSITNITLQQIGVSEPFSLSFTGTTTNGVRVQELTGEPGFEYYVQSSTNLLDWVDFAVLVNTNGTVRFYDQSLTNGQTKFYRAIAP